MQGSDTVDYLQVQPRNKLEGWLSLLGSVPEAMLWPAAKIRQKIS